MASKSQTGLVPYNGSISSEHIVRYIQKTLGATDEAIAKAEGVSVEVVKRSIRKTEIYRETNSLDAVNLAIGHQIMDLTVDAKTAIRSGMKAHKYVKRYVRRKGKLQERFIRTPDHEIQLAAVGEFRGLVEAIQPKGTKINNNVNASASATAAASSFSEASYQPGVEEMIDKIRSKVDEQNRVPRELGTIKDDDADIIEGDPEDIESAETSDGALGEEEEVQPPVTAEMSP
jgi:hypothetical protein